jgi:hypothetical protein
LKLSLEVQAEVVALVLSPQQTEVEVVAVVAILASWQPQQPSVYLK